MWYLVKLDGKSPEEFGLLFLKDHYHPATPEMRNRTMTIPGMNGEWDFGSEWGPRPFTLPFGIIEYDRYELQRKLRAFVAFLLDAYGKPREIKLSFDYEPDKYYLVKMNSRLDVERALHTGRLDLPLIAHKPFAYAEMNAYDPVTKHNYDEGFTKVYSSTATFNGKIVGSTVGNPHTAKWGSYTSLTNPSTFASELSNSQANHETIKVLDGNVATLSNGSTGRIPQMLFSFNLIEEYQRKSKNTIPGSTTAEKVTWLKNNLTRLTCNWFGRGTGPAGNKSSITGWNAFSNTWSASPVSHSNGVITQISFSTNDISSFIDNAGFVHILSYPDASDGVTASSIFTDYVEMIMETKDGWLEVNPNESAIYYDSELYYDNTAEFDWSYTKQYVGIHNYSVYKTPLILTVEGTVINPRITNQTTGKTLYLPTISNQRLTVDSGSYSVKIDEVHQLNNVRGIEDFTIVSGDNSLLFEGGLSEATVTFKWKHRFI